jgi:AraC-like DNA-binding protein
VEQVWRTRSENPGSFLSAAASNFEIVFTRQGRRTVVTMRGPETKARLAPVPEYADFVGITFKLGTFMPHLPASRLLDAQIDLPEASDHSFWLDSLAWQIPRFENAEVFVQRLVRRGLLAREPLVRAALEGQMNGVSLRSLQRRFLYSTGLSQRAIVQIQRARQAMELLERGKPILETVHELGYYDQPHMTRALRRLVGQTPAQILQGSRSS